MIVEAQTHAITTLGHPERALGLIGGTEVENPRQRPLRATLMQERQFPLKEGILLHGHIFGQSLFVVALIF